MRPVPVGAGLVYIESVLSKRGSHPIRASTMIELAYVG